MRVFSNYQIIFLCFLIISTLIVAQTKTMEGAANMANDTLTDTQTLKPGFGITSKNGKYMMEYGTKETLKIIRLKTDKDGDVSMRDDSVVIDTIWDSGLKNVEREGSLRFTEGVLAVYDDKGEVRWKSDSKGAGGASSKLVMGDDGKVSIFDVGNKVIWSVPTKVVEGLTNIAVETDNDDVFNSKYEANLTDQRIELQKGMNDLLHLQSNDANTSKSQMDSSILINIFWTALASSMIYYLAVSV